MIRLDKLVSQLNIGTRSEVKSIIKRGEIQIDDKIIKDPSIKVSENCKVKYKGKDYKYSEFRYFVLNKPQGYVCASKDNIYPTVMDIFEKKYGANMSKSYFPVGRLDKDTEGLLLITNDGDLSHKLLSYKYHVDKKYYVKTDCEITKDMKDKLQQKMDLGEDEISHGSICEIINSDECFLTIFEGKYHQVKRMFHLVGNEVSFLKRCTFGPLELDENLSVGDIIELNENSIEKLRKCCEKNEAQK